MTSVIHDDTGPADGPAPFVDAFCLLIQFIRYCLSEDQAADLALAPQFMNAGCRAYQNVRPMRFLSIELDLKLSIRSVARVFNTSHSSVDRLLLCAYEDPPERGRHRELSPEVERALVEWIAEK
jgi:hypothetical protein